MNTNILDFGAIADGITLNTTAIQNAIDKCAQSGGGRVTIPQGTYKSGTIWLRSNVELHLEMGAELLASDNMDDYNELDAFPQNSRISVNEGWVGKHLIIALEIDNCAITGFGTVNGNCHAFVTEGDFPDKRYFGWCHGISILKDTEKLRPGQLICFIESTNIKVQDISIKDSPCWSCYFLGCEYVGVRGIKIKNPVWMLNSDGIDIDASRYVTVSDCIIDTGDDAITLRACEQKLKNKSMHCEYVTITNCVLRTGICAFRIGVGYGTIRHARISNITISLCENIVQFCTAYVNKGQANIEDVNFSNISAENADRIFEIFAENGTYIKNVTFDNIRSTASMRNYIDCINGEIDNLTFRNIELNFFDKAMNLDYFNHKLRGTQLLSFKGANNLTLDNFKVNGGFYGVSERIAVENCENLIQKDCQF